MNFKDYILESLDSNFIIEKVEVVGNVSLYYLHMKNDKNYRIFIEEVKDKSGVHLHLGFERKIGEYWVIDEITNDLTTKEVLGLFGTIKDLVLRKSFNSLFFITSEPKKAQLYHNMARKLNVYLKFKSIIRDKNSVIITDGTFNPSTLSKLKYKK